jgi:hypothetical protein
VDDFAVAASDQALVDEPMEERDHISGEYLMDGSVLFTQPRRIQELVDDQSDYPSFPCRLNSMTKMILLGARV